MGLVAAVVVAAGIAGCGGGGSDGGEKRTCSSFRYQEDAQDYHRTNPSSGLDGDKDGIACESLPRRPASPPVISNVDPTGVWTGTLNSSDGIRGVVFPSGDTWFLRTRSVTGSSPVPTWLLHGAGASSGSTFRIPAALTVSLDGGTVPARTAFTATVQKASSLSGSWIQGASTYSMQASYQAVQLPPVPVASLAGSYGDPSSPAPAPAAVSVDKSGVVSIPLNATCALKGQITLGMGDPAYRLSVSPQGTCSSGVKAGTGIALYDKTNSQLYLAAISSDETSAIFAVGTRR